MRGSGGTFRETHSPVMAPGDSLGTRSCGAGVGGGGAALSMPIIRASSVHQLSMTQSCRAISG